MLVAMAAVATLVVADDGPGTFRVKPEFPASQADPCKHTYVTLLLDASGPGGTFSEARVAQLFCTAVCYNIMPPYIGIFSMRVVRK